MNKVILMGRLTRDPETRYSQGASGTAVCRYSLAVNRSYKRDGEPDADFFNIVAFGNRGEFAGKYFRKGMMVAVVGELRNGSYTDKDGNKRYTTDVVVSEQHFAEKKADSANNGSAQQPNPNDFAPASSAPAPQPRQQQQYAAPPQQQQYAAPQQQYAPADGFMPMDDMEGDEDLPF